MIDAEAFTTFPGRCFRFVVAANGRSRHCTNPAVHSGKFTDAKGRLWTVDACEEHAQDPQFRAGVSEVRARNFRVGSPKDP